MWVLLMARWAAIDSGVHGPDRWPIHWTLFNEQYIEHTVYWIHCVQRWTQFENAQNVHKCKVYTVTLQRNVGLNMALHRECTENARTVRSAGSRLWPNIPKKIVGPEDGQSITTGFWTKSYGGQFGDQFGGQHGGRFGGKFFVEFSLRDLKFGNRLSINSAGCHRTLLDS